MAKRDSEFYIQIGCGFFIFGALFLCSFVAVFGKIQSDHRWDGGVRVEGVVTSVEAEMEFERTSLGYTGRKRIVSESVVFEYPVGSQPLYQRQYFSYDSPFYTGQSVPIIYLPNTPWVAEILFDPPNDPRLPVAIGAGILLIAITLFTFMVKPRDKGKKKHKHNGSSIP